MQEDQTRLFPSHENSSKPCPLHKQRQILLESTRGRRQDVSLACAQKVW
jgi:hypothetical protein